MGRKGNYKKSQTVKFIVITLVLAILNSCCTHRVYEGQINIRNSKAGINIFGFSDIIVKDGEVYKIYITSAMGFPVMEIEKNRINSKEASEILNMINKMIRKNKKKIKIKTNNWLIEFKINRVSCISNNR